MYRTETGHADRRISLRHTDTLLSSPTCPAQPAQQSHSNLGTHINSHDSSRLRHRPLAAIPSIRLPSCCMPAPRPLIAFLTPLSASLLRNPSSTCPPAQPVRKPTVLYHDCRYLSPIGHSRLTRKSPASTAACLQLSSQVSPLCPLLHRSQQAPPLPLLSLFASMLRPNRRTVGVPHRLNLSYSSAATAVSWCRQRVDPP